MGEIVVRPEVEQLLQFAPRMFELMCRLNGLLRTRMAQFCMSPDHLAALSEIEVLVRELDKETPRSK